MTAGLQSDDISADRPDLQCRSDSCDDVGEGHAAVQQQDIDEFRVPAESPLTRRAAAQNASCAEVKVPASRTAASALEPGKAPGLILSTSR